jgi:nucleotide-binding universal stress UspA family protein
MSKSLFFATNGAAVTQPALDYGVWLAHVMHLPVTLLAALEQPHGALTPEAESPRLALEQQVEHVIHLLELAGLPCEVLHAEGNARQAICRLADPQKHLLVVGPLGRSTWRRMVHGRSLRRILQGVNAPLIYVPPASERSPAKHRLKKALLCSGGLGYTISVSQWVAYLASKTEAELTLLHVVEMAYYHYPVANQIQEHWHEILQTDTPQARGLRQDLEFLEKAGVKATLRVRQGDIVSGIMKEIEEGDYDLIAMGAQGNHHHLRALATPNITALVAEAARIPVLIARAGQDLIF